MKKRIIVILSFFLFLNANATQYTQQDVQRFSAYYSNGIEYLKNQQFTSAINEFRKVLRFSPYDETIQDALANAYYARAQYYRTTTKEVKKALNDYKSAYFYSKYWKDTQQSQAQAQLSYNALKAINELEKRLDIAQTPNARFQNARNLRALGELAAAGYDYQALKQSERPERIYENLGDIYRNLNNISQAMDYYRASININPKNAKAHFSYAVLLDEAGNFDASIEEYNLALQYGNKSPELLEILEHKWTQSIVNNPSNAQGYINLGAIYQKQGNLQDAKTQYLKAYQLDGNDTTALYNLASLYVEQKNYQDAIDTYDKLLAKKPNDIELLEYKANALISASRFDEAVAQYEAILAINPNNQNAKNAKENLIFNNFTPEKLRNYLAQKANNNPKNYEDQFNYALELHKLKDYDNALIYYKKAMNINPSKEENYLNLAQIYIEKKDYKNANEICQKGLILMPQNQKLEQYLADIKNYVASTQYDEATALFEAKQYDKALGKYLSIANKTTVVKMAIASCYWQLNDYNNANKYYLDVIANEPNNLEALLNSAFMYSSLGDFENAKIGAKKVLQIDRTNKDAIDLISEIEKNETAEMLQDAIAKFEQQDYSSALNLLNKYLSAKPDDEYGIYYKALILDEQKKNSQAVELYKKLIAKNPSFAEAYYSLAVDLDNLEKYEEAVSNYEKFISKRASTKDEMTNFATSRIKELKDYLEQLNASK